MKVTVNGYQVARFGEQYARRAEGEGEWETVDELPDDEMFELRVQEHLRDGRIASGPRMRTTVIRRSERNEAIAHELGLNADELAERLQAGDSRFASTLGTGERVSEERFDAIAVELGLDPQNMRDRFAGRA